MIVDEFDIGIEEIRARANRYQASKGVTLSKQGPPGPPPRPGLEWKDETSRWIRPDGGEEEHTGPHFDMGVWKAPAMPELSQEELQDTERRFKLGHEASEDELVAKWRAYSKRAGEDSDPEAVTRKRNGINRALGTILWAKYPDAAKALYERVAGAGGHIVSSRKLSKETGLSAFAADKIGSLLGFNPEFQGWPGKDNDSIVYLVRPQPEQGYFDSLGADALWKELDDVHGESRHKRLPPDLAVRRSRILDALRKNEYGMSDEEVQAISRQNATVGGWFSDTTHPGGQVKRAALAMIRGEDPVEKVVQDVVAMKGWDAAGVREMVVKTLGRNDMAVNASALGKQHRLATDYLRRQHGDEVTLYRGVVNDQARELLGRAGQEASVNVASPSSSSLNSKTAEGYAKSSPIKRDGTEGAVMQVTVPVEDIWVHGDLDAPGDFFVREEEYGTVGVSRVSIMDKRY